MSEEAKILHEAIELLYATFKPYRLLPHIAGCPCCISGTDNKRIHSRPLRDLPPSDLARFAFKAMTTWGEVTDFKHFLPRLFECIDEDPTANYVDTEVILGKLAYGKWRVWPQSEQEAIEVFLMAFWRVALQREPKDGWQEAEDYLCAIAQAEDDLSPYLNVWEEGRGISAIYQLATLLIRRGHGILQKQKLSNAFWDRREAQMQQVITWLRRPAILKSMERAYLDHQEKPIASDLSHACGVLEELLAQGPF